MVATESKEAYLLEALEKCSQERLSIYLAAESSRCGCHLHRYIKMRSSAFQEESCLRAQFFIYNQVSHNVKSQRGGHSTILILGQITGDRLPNLPLGLSLDTFCKALPVRLKKAYFTHCPDQEDGVDERSFLINLLPVAISWAGSSFEDRLFPVFDSNRTEVLAQLQAIGGTLELEEQLERKRRLNATDSGLWSSTWTF
jgi:hypothetical protein